MNEAMVAAAYAISRGPGSASGATGGFLDVCIGCRRLFDCGHREMRETNTLEALLFGISHRCPIAAPFNNFTIALNKAAGGLSGQVANRDRIRVLSSQVLYCGQCCTTSPTNHSMLRSRQLQKNSRSTRAPHSVKTECGARVRCRALAQE